MCLDEELRDQLVCGLRSEAIQKYLLTEADLDLKKAFEISQAMEAATRQTMELQGATPVDSAHCVTNKITTKQGKRSCYCCGGRHSPNDCRFKEQQCKKCNKQGHIAKMCRSGNNTGNSKTTKKVQYVENTTPDSPHDSDDICLLNIHSAIIIHPVLNGKQEWTLEPLEYLVFHMQYRL